MTSVRVAVLAGGRGSRLGGSKALVALGGEPLIAHVLRAAAGFDTVVVAKPSTELPSIDVPVWVEPEQPSHPLCGLVAALEHGEPVVAVACDQPWVTADLLARLAEAPAVCAVDGRDEPFPGHYDPAQLPVLREALAAEASLRRTIAALDPARVAVARDEVASINTPEELAAAERRLSPPEVVEPDARTAAAPPRPGATPHDGSTATAPT
jgi:molybdopterin-guanine dinucleotide biosynthesis protein A